MACHSGSSVELMSRNEAVCLIDGSAHALENKFHEMTANQRTAVDGLKTQLNLVQHQVHDLLDQRLVKNEDLDIHRNLLNEVHTELKELKGLRESDHSQLSMDLDTFKKDTETNLDIIREKTEDIAAHCSELHHMFTHQETDQRPSFLTHVCAAVGISTWSAIGVFTWCYYISKGLGLVQTESNFHL
jgi:hypothetical protein